MPHARTSTTSLADQAYQAIRDEILGGQRRPGTTLSRRGLAVELGMSVIPVNDALRRLQGDGLVESRPRAGTRVRVPTREDVRALYELREALETQSARLFAERATPAQRADLRRRGARLDVLFGRLAARPDDPALRFAVHSEHVRFHMRIAERAGSSLVREMIERNHVLTLNWLFDVAARHTPLPRRFHSELAQAVASRQPARADAVMRAHVRYGLGEISAEFAPPAPSKWRGSARAKREDRPRRG
jgi:DNA-binding GntR family transcriptional regulator